MDLNAIRRFWRKSVLNRVALVMSMSLVVCCCGWTGRIGGAGSSAPSAQAITAAWPAGRP